MERYREIFHIAFKQARQNVSPCVCRYFSQYLPILPRVTSPYSPYISRYLPPGGVVSSEAPPARDAPAEMQAGQLRGLSLGTDMVMDETGSVLYRSQAELSICEEGKRDGTWVDTIDGRTVHAVACASKAKAKSGALR